MIPSRESAPEVPRRQIDGGLAVSIASQVAAGLAPGDLAEERARSALTAIGLFVRNASGLPEVGEVLDMIAGTTVSAEDGVLAATYVPPDEPAA